MLKCENIHKKYGDLHILKGISLEVKPSEIVAIVGSSGAGKTTLLQILGTLDQPNEGTLEISETDVNRLNNKQLSKFRNQDIGFVFQFHQLLPEFTAIENVCIPGFIGKRNKKEVKSRAKELLDYLGLQDRYDHKPSQLSGGEKQRVAVARALINSPKIVFADEPSGNLDSENSRELYQLFDQIRKDFGNSFVIVTHDVELSNLADRKIIISDGKLV
ncbi:MAG: ABC transporter ATP-binding protein [Crocinitomicaceae bacterium]|nr:ABC transporter ATP-binding protein [Crocinitomicaceae bacterium]